jgi:hypothetical protein
VDEWIFAHNSTSLRSLQIYKRVRFGQKFLSDEEAERVLSHWTSLDKLDVNGAVWEASIAFCFLRNPDAEVCDQREQVMKGEELQRVIRRMPDAQTPFWGRENAYR